MRSLESEHQRLAKKQTRCNLYVACHKRWKEIFFQIERSERGRVGGARGWRDRQHLDTRKGI